MKKILIFAIFIINIPHALGQELLGNWYAKTSIKDEEVHFVTDFRRNDGAIKGFIDLPSNNLFRLKLDSVSISGDYISLNHKGLNLRYRGFYDKKLDKILGEIEKDDFKDSLVFSREPSIQRIQKIKMPIPYTTRNISFYNKDSIKFSGTITYQENSDNQKAVILISGSGPQDRNEEMLGHKPFKILADHLTRKGIAVLRYDDRGFGKSGGQFRPATTEDYAEDVKGAIDFIKNFKEFSIGSIGLIGHSEGGNIAPMVAAEENDIKFIVLLAAPGKSNYESYIVSLDLLLKDYPETYERDFALYKSVYKDMAQINSKEILIDSLKSKFQNYAEKLDEKEVSMYGGIDSFIKGQIEAHTTDWYHYFLQFDVTEYLQQLKIPILALNGDRDISIEADFNLNGIKETLTQSGNKNFKTVKLRNVNHFFQTSFDDKIENVYFNTETFSDQALNEISNWILKL